MLLHAPSGAGKTSLIQAGLIPLLEKRRFRPTPPARAKTQPDDDFHVHSRYIYGVALDLLHGKRDPNELAGSNLRTSLKNSPPTATGEGHPVLILDQFEELLSINPTDWKNQKVFFRELGTALQNGRVWTLFSMREDYMGGVDASSGTYLVIYRRHTGSTFSINVRRGWRSSGPARECEVEFADDAAALLVTKLGKVLVARPCAAPRRGRCVVHPAGPAPGGVSQALDVGRAGAG